MSGRAPTIVFETADGFDRASIIGDAATLGRDAACDVRIDHPTVSRRHARLVRDGEDRWRYERLGSQSAARAARDAVDLDDGATLRLGGVRAWFFLDAPPDEWMPDDEPPASKGKLVRCRCGHVGWAPEYTAGMAVRCKACRGEIVIGDDREPTRSRPATPQIAPCPGCRTAIEPTEGAHTCPECGARMHVECHRELGGCATYGCPRINELRRVQTPAEAIVESKEAPTPTSSSRRDRWPIVTWTLVGLVTFGVPAFVWATAAFAKRRSGSGTVALVGGAAGAAASFVGWSLALNDGAWPW